MFTLFNKIENIVYYTINEKYLILKDNDLNFIFNNQIVTQNIYDDLIVTNDKVFYNDLEGFNIYDLKNNTSIDYDTFSILNTKPMSNQIGVIIRNEDEQLFLFDKIKLEKTKLNIENYNWGLIFCSDEHLFIQDNSSIKSYSIKQNKLLWHFNLNQLGTFINYNGETVAYKAEKIIGVHQNELLLACNNHCILSIDIDTGNILHTFTLKELDLYQDGKHFPLAEGFVYDKKSEILFSFYGWYYIEINLKTRKINFFNAKDSLSNHNIIAFRASLNYAYNDTHIFTIAERDILKLGINWMQRSLIAFNKKTKVIDWQYVFEKTSVNTDTPKLAGNKLYQLDGDNTLHIFEKTENETV